MQIVFSRHGNTFAPGDRVVWVGAETDLPLVASGVAQAEAAARALVRADLIPEIVYCGPLRRTRGYAEIVVAKILGAGLGGGIEIRVDPRLNEVRYGPWAGLTSQEIEENLGQGRQLAAWSQADIWPHDAGWLTTEAEVLANVTDFAADIVQRHGDSRVLVISSNGTLRYFPRLAPESLTLPSSQMKTGYLGLMTHKDGTYRLDRWNIGPETL
ncbi:MAG: histidine phosphatase family protein [Alphaproteobacteria bacterium]|nr:histidine phosphatase family protein [Alphaproteobacteria bacterium]